MQLRPESRIELHEHYHRKEGRGYLIGRPETGEFLTLTPAEFRAVQLLERGLAYRHAQELLRGERDRVDLHALVLRLRRRGFIHRVDTKVVAPRHEPLHEFQLPLANLGGPGVRFFLALLSLAGLAALLVFGGFPSPHDLFVYPSLTATLLTVVAVAWLLIGIRQVAAYAAAQHLGLPARFGVANVYHAFVLKTFLPRTTERQAHYVLGTGLLALTATTGLALLLSIARHSAFWQLVFALGVLELLAECLLFLETDLARFVAASVNVHKLNEQTADALRDDFRLLFHGGRRETHPAQAAYAFFYLLSIVLAAVLLLAYILPAMLQFLLEAFRAFQPGAPGFTDAALALLFFTTDLLLYALGVLRHHHLNNNALFVNAGLATVVAASYLAVSIGVELLQTFAPGTITAFLTFFLGIALASVFAAATRFAHPFARYHGAFEGLVLPVVAASLPLSVLFTTTYTAWTYVYSIALGLGMLGVASSYLFSRRAGSR